MQTDEVVAETDGPVELRRLFDDGNGCDHFSQRVIDIAAGEAGAEQIDADADEVLYVLDGGGTATIGGVDHTLGSGGCAFVPRRVSRMLAAGDEGLRALSVLVHDPEPGEAAAAVVHVDRGDSQRATAGRQFALGVGPEQGCASVTQFVGFVPPGRAPDHFHRYDEVVYILEGEGVLHIDGAETSLRRGSAVHFPAKLVHSLENSGPGELHVLGVFRPAGSPAEAYYPDGTLASVPEE